jgi:hypothetical protein
VSNRRESEARDQSFLVTKRGGSQGPLLAFDLLRLNGDDLRQRSFSPFIPAQAPWF